MRKRAGVPTSRPSASSGPSELPQVLIDEAVPGEPTVLARVRRLIAHHLSPRKDADLVVLAASELVGNAVIHGKEPIRLRVVAEGASIRLEVSDRSPNLPVPQPALSENTSSHGRGLRIVEALADHMGLELSPDAEGEAKIVWADFTCPLPLSSVHRPAAQL